MGLTYFISDVHLGTYSDAIEKDRIREFVLFLRDVEKDATAVFFVGDLFDFWFEYKYVIPKGYFPVIHQLARMRDKNITITYLAGNHDFWLGSFFDEQLAIKTVANEWTGTIDGKRFYLFHGDGVAKNDVGYRILKRFLRHRWSLRLYRLFHPDFGIPFARFVSGSSRKYTNRVDLNDREDYIDFARERFREGYDYVMMGHRHHPFELSENGKKYVNIGDWLVHFTYFTFDGKDLRMHSAKDRFA